MMNYNGTRGSSCDTHIMSNEFIVFKIIAEITKELKMSGLFQVFYELLLRRAHF